MLATRERGSAALRVALGRGAVARPRQAALSALLVLGLAAVGWLALARPWREAVPQAGPASVSAARMTAELARSGVGPARSDVRVLWGIPEYFRLTGQQALASEYGAEENLVFLVWENVHEDDLGEALRPLLRVDGGVGYLPKQVLVPANAVHHRFSVLVYPRTDAAGRPLVGPESRSLEIALPPASDGGPQSLLQWSLPLETSGAASGAGFQLTGASILALAGGVLSSMWPCLFQLTAYFIPALAGISASQASRREEVAVARTRVLKTAGVFVLGFVIVYTFAGAMAGFAAQWLGGTSAFWSWRRPISIGAGLFILLVAARLAASARAPLVCRMPVVSSLGKKNTGYLGTMFLGLAFAAGCTTCFGAALVLGMVTYAGIAGTPLTGALIMLVFSLGMAIPLIAGAAAMARALSALARFERLGRYMVLASSVVLAGFAVLLLSDRSMFLTNLVARGVPGP